MSNRRWWLCVYVLELADSVSAVGVTRWQAGEQKHMFRLCIVSQLLQLLVMAHCSIAGLLSCMYVCVGAEVLTEHS